LSEDAKSLVGVFLDVFEEKEVIKETVFFRSDGYSVIKLIFGGIAYDFTDH
jgi:hypothetical protein